MLIGIFARVKEITIQGTTKVVTQQQLMKPDKTISSMDLK